MTLTIRYPQEKKKVECFLTHDHEQSLIVLNFEKQFAILFFLSPQPRKCFIDLERKIKVWRRDTKRGELISYFLHVP